MKGEMSHEGWKAIVFLSFNSQIFIHLQLWIDAYNVIDGESVKPQAKLNSLRMDILTVDIH